MLERDAFATTTGTDRLRHGRPRDHLLRRALLHLRWRDWPRWPAGSRATQRIQRR